MYNDPRYEAVPTPPPAPMPMPSCCCGCCRLLEVKTNLVLELLLSIQTGKAVDLAIVFGLQPPAHAKGKNAMANQKATGPGVVCPCLAPKSGTKKAVMPGVTLTSPAPASITLQPLDANGNPIGLTPADTVTTTLTSDSANLVISAGADSAHYVGTIPANTPQGSVANLAATLKGTIQGAPADLTASVAVTINLPPNPVAVDLAIVFG